MSDLEIKVTRYHCSGNDVACISLKGILDSLARGKLEQTARGLLGENIVHYIVDLSDVTSVGSTGIGFLIKLAAQIQGRSGGLVVIGANERLKSAADLLGLWTYISLADNLEHALKLVLSEFHLRNDN